MKQRLLMINRKNLIQDLPRHYAFLHLNHNHLKTSLQILILLLQ